MHESKFGSDFINLLDSCGFKQYVEFPTHKSGNTLDLIFSRENELPLNNFAWDATVSPDHFTVLCQLSVDKLPDERKQFTTRKWKSLDANAFELDVYKSNITSILDCDSVSAAVQTYNKVLTDILDQHAPIQVRVAGAKQKSPWYNQDAVQSVSGENPDWNQIERNFGNPVLTLIIN